MNCRSTQPRHLLGSKGNILWFESSGHNPIDWRHHSWFPNRQIQRGSNYSYLGATLNGLSNSPKIFRATNGRMDNYNITGTNLRNTKISLDANALTEMTRTFPPTLAREMALKNYGAVTLNVTDGFTKTAPDRSALNNGRDHLSPGEQDSIHQESHLVPASPSTKLETN